MFRSVSDSEHDKHEHNKPLFSYFCKLLNQYHITKEIVHPALISIRDTPGWYLCQSTTFNGLF